MGGILARATLAEGIYSRSSGGALLATGEHAGFTTSQRIGTPANGLIPGTKYHDGAEDLPARDRRDKSGLKTAR